MDIQSAKQAALKWGVHIRVVQQYCKEGRISGAFKYGNNWLLPADAPKPVSSRTKSEGQPDDETEEDAKLCFEISYLYSQGHFRQAKELYSQAKVSHRARLYAASQAIAAAICTGDYPYYSQINEFLSQTIEAYPNTEYQTLAELAQATAALSMFAPAMAPQWIRQADFERVPSWRKPYAVYLYIKYLQNTRQHAAMAASAKVAATLIQPWNSVPIGEVYLHLLTATAAHAMRNIEDTVFYFKVALDLGMPYGLLSAYADYLSGCGGILEDLIKRYYPKELPRIQKLWQTTFPNWVSFHNRFTKDHLCDMLSLSEYQLAELLAHGASYQEAARRLNKSVGVISNRATELYQKLCIQKKKELKKFIF